jgi:aminopeptidase N
LELAKARALNISRLRYELALSIPDALAQPVTGTSVLRFHLADPTKPLVIDFDAAAAPEATVAVNGAAVPTRAINGHLVIPAAPLRQGENTVHIDFRAGDAPLNRSRDFLYTWFVPAHAHQAMPCFDQPDLKGRWTVTLEHPAQWQSVANGAELDRQRTGPALVSARLPWRPFRQVLAHCSRRDPNAQLDQWFVRDALFAPQHVLPRHPANQPA